MMRGYWSYLVLLITVVVLSCLSYHDSFAIETTSMHLEWNPNNELDVSEPLSDYDFSGIQEFLDRQQIGNEIPLSFTDLMKDLMAGNFMDLLARMGTAIKQSLFSEVSASSNLMGQIMVLGIIGAVFTNFSSVFTSSQISETGFFVTYLLLFTFLASSFFASIQIANQVVGQVLEFMQTLLPSYFLAVAFAGGSISSIALYEFTLFIISLVEWLFFNLLIPMVRVYILLVLAGHIAKDDILSKLTDLLKHVIEWSMKTLLSFVVGFHLIQGLVLPYVDSIKSSAIHRFVEVIPGVGSGVSAVAQMVLGSGVLIKNTIGVAAIVILGILVIIPMLKLIIIMVLYQCVAAVMQPVCDKRMVDCISCVAQGHKMLLQIALSVVFLFVLTIGIVCATTNITYYAG